MADDLIRRQDAIDALEREKTYCTAFREGYTPINVFEKYNAGLTDGIKVLKNLPSAQPERCEDCANFNKTRLVMPQPEQKWIPVTDRLPEKNGFYLVSVGAEYQAVRVYEYKPCYGYENENLWKGNDGCYCFNWFVEAWMPLPKSWRGEEE